MRLVPLAVLADSHARNRLAQLGQLIGLIRPIGLIRQISDHARLRMLESNRPHPVKGLPFLLDNRLRCRRLRARVALQRWALGHPRIRRRWWCVIRVGEMCGIWAGRDHHSVVQCLENAHHC